jgi:predicted deacylase
VTDGAHSLDDQVALVVREAVKHRDDPTNDWPGVPPTRLPRSARRAITEALARGLVSNVIELHATRKGRPTAFIVPKEIS